MPGCPRFIAPALVGAAILASASLLVAQPPEPARPDLLLGTWRLDLTQSRYSPGPGPKSERRIYTRDASGVKGRIDRHYSDGRHEVIDYSTEFDRDVAVTGTQAYDAVRLRRVDDYTTEGVLSHAGRVFGLTRRVISPDGETMTITFRREEPGEMVNNFAVYRRER
jgi:hypothetical protein